MGSFNDLQNVAGIALGFPCLYIYDLQSSCKLLPHRMSLWQALAVLYPLQVHTWNPNQCPMLYKK